MHSQTLITQLNVTSHVLKRNVEGLTHQDSLRRPQPAGNDMNWVLGHVVKTRQQFLKMLGGGSPVPDSKYDAYGEEPLTDPKKAIKLEELLRDYDAMQKPLLDTLAKLPSAKLAEKAPFSPTGNPDETLGSLLAAFVFHESYHMGQLGLQRRLCGKPGVLTAPRAKQGA
jgi:uncharacterized damage-inducible protein DinB